MLFCQGVFVCKKRGMEKEDWVVLIHDTDSNTLEQHEMTASLLTCSNSSGSDAISSNTSDDELANDILRCSLDKSTDTYPVTREREVAVAYQTSTIPTKVWLHHIQRNNHKYQALLMVVIVCHIVGVVMIWGKRWR